MSSGRLSEHLAYLTDARKIQVYRSALLEVVRPESVVLDLGAGTGLLGFIAAQCGARRVYAVDYDPILNMARETATRSGFAERIVHLRGLSTEIDLPEQVDVIVCDQIGGFVHDAGILHCYADAMSRLLKPGGILVPSGFELRLTPVADSELAARVGDWSLGPDGMDFSAFAEISANTEHRVNAPRDCALGSDVTIAQIRSDHNSHYGGVAELVIERSGALCGLLGTFVAQMSPGVTMTNAPWGEDPMRRWQNFYPLSEPVDVEPGDVVRTTIDVSPPTGMVAWRGSIFRADGSAGPSFAHDTLRGSFSGPESTIRASDTWVPAPTSRLGLARTVLDLADGHRSIAQIALLVNELRDAQFVSDEHARSFVRSVLGPVVDG